MRQRGSTQIHKFMWKIFTFSYSEQNIQPTEKESDTEKTFWLSLEMNLEAVNA